MKRGEIDYKLYHYDALLMEKLRLEADNKELKAAIQLGRILCGILFSLLFLSVIWGAFR